MSSIEAWKAQQDGLTNKSMFWEKLAEHVGTHSADTLRKYCQGEKTLQPELMAVISAAVVGMGGQFKEIGGPPTRTVIAPELMDLSINLVLCDDGSGKPQPNRIEPGEVYDLELSAALDVGEKTISFGVSEDSPDLYVAKIVVHSGRLTIESEELKSRSSDTMGSTHASLREVGDPSDIRSVSWMLEDLQEHRRTRVLLDLGSWSGHYSEADVLTFSVNQLDLRARDFEYKMGGQLDPEEVKSLRTPEVAAAIEARRKEILNEALRSQLSRQHTLAIVPLFEASR